MSDRDIEVKCMATMDITNISRGLARSNNALQALFLNDMFNTMDIEFTKHHKELQLSFIADELELDCINSLKGLIEFYELKNKTEKKE